MYRNNRIESVDNENRFTVQDNLEIWVKLARELPWNLFEDQFAAMTPENLDGTPAQRVRILLGTVVIQKVYGLSPEDTIDLIRKNSYLQYFIGLKEYCADLPFAPDVLEAFGLKVSDATMTEIIEFITKVAPQVSKAQPILKTSTKTKPDALGNSSLERGLLEQTQEMPVLTKENASTEFGLSLFQNWYFRVADFYFYCYLNTRDFWVGLVGRIHQFIHAASRKYTESFELRPEIKAGLDSLKKWGGRVCTFLGRMLSSLCPFNHVWLRIILIIPTIVFLFLVAVIIRLPVPAPRMLVASEVYDTRHRLVATFFSENRRPVKLKEVPAFLRDAVLAVEDHRFYSHQGINPGRILKAALYDLLHGNLEQGGSTITQQLVKNVYLTHERTFSRKFQEILYSIKLEYKLSKDRILELYLNKIYFGHGAYGVKVAAETYFQKELNQLNQAEMALLAGLPRGPAFYSPYNHPKAARRRLRQTLLRMKACGYLTAAQYQNYCHQPLNLRGIKKKNNAAPYFMDLLQNEFNLIFPDNPELIYTAGLKIESTLDLEMQQAAVKAFQDGLPVVYHPAGSLSQPQGALIALDLQNGEIRALLGGSDYTKSQFNRAVQAKRQPGSAFKPILYTAAFKSGFTLASKIDREPKTYYIYGKPYRPTDQHSGSGMISLRKALAQSSNVVAVKLIERIGFKPVLKMAERLGIKSQLRPHLSLALGACEVTPLELATAYATLASGGVRNQPGTIRRILNEQGRIIYQRKSKGVAAIDPAFAFLTTQAMREVLKSGTAAKIGRKLDRPAAGKTGTTNSNRDAWFVGYTPDLLACVFVGCDNYERALPGMASQVAAPIWAAFMIEALKDQPAKEFPVPDNIEKVSLCKFNGKLAGKSCSSYTEYFLKGTKPLEVCNGNHFRSFLKQLFGNSSGTDKTIPSPNAAEPSRKESRRRDSGKNRNLFKRIWDKIK
jgi:1A family penicillin-binding protein